ncbi:hypothetical protein [Rhizobium sp. WYCCWR 11152]|uniref:hypothetical protein n=1 Tax=Rhizobium sp. WYCCWR 11152 TaxID=2692316 RepID=UPI001FEDDA7A|nr:hypothetical protein [Rhizobium sp. WYCCWR 11152]
MIVSDTTHLKFEHSPELGLALTSSAGFDFSQASDEQLVERHAVKPMMGVAVAVGAYSNNVAWAVGASVRKPMHVVALDISSSVRSFERALAPAMLAMSSGASQYVIPNISAASEGGAICRDALRRGFRGSKRAPAKLSQIYFFVGSDWLDLIKLVSHIIDAAKFENDRISHVAHAIWRLFVMVTFVDQLSFVTQTSVDRGEEMNCLACLPRIHNCSVARFHFHMANLALTEIFKYPVWAPSIDIAVLVPFLSADEEDYGGVGGSDDAAALLPAIDAMDIRDTVVNLADVKRHSVLAKIVPSLIGCGSFRTVKEAA